MKSEIIVGDFLYCELSFKDPTITRYLWINSVNVTSPVDKRLKDVYPTGYYYRGYHTSTSTRFVILVYWPEKMANIAVTAKVKRDAECGNDNDDCIECHGNYDCFACNNGKYAQAKECVDHCDLGYYQGKGVCKPCLLNCKTCRTPRTCQECNSPSVLYDNKC